MVGFEQLKDNRRRNILKCPLDELLLVALAILLTDGETYTDVADFDVDKLDPL